MYLPWVHFVPHKPSSQMMNSTKLSSLKYPEMSGELYPPTTLNMLPSVISLIGNISSVCNADPLKSTLELKFRRATSRKTKGRNSHL